MLQGALITDMRDFLKLRFRCKGLTGAESAPSTAIQQGLKTGDLHVVLEELDIDDSIVVVTGYVVNYVVTNLDDLSRNTTISRYHFYERVRILRDILRAMARWLYPERYGHDHYDRYIDTLFEEPAE